MLASCGKQETSTPNPWRKIVDYKPSTFTMTVEGNVSAINTDWITMNQSGNTVTFTTTRNLTGLIRRAEFPVSGSNFKVIVNQKSGSIDASLSSSLVSQSLGQATVNINISTSNIDDYESWGIIYGKENDRSKGTTLPQDDMFVAGNNPVTLTDLEEGEDYYVWAYVETTEGDIVYTSNTTGIVPPVYVAAGDDLQAAIDGVNKDYTEVRVSSDYVHNGTLKITNQKSMSITGGWNEDFSQQEPTKKSVIDGGFNKAEDADGNPFDFHKAECRSKTYVSTGNGSCAVVIGSFTAPLKSDLVINNFEIRNGFDDNDGGAMQIATTGNVSVDNCYIHDCHSNHRAGGPMNVGNVDGGTIVFSNTVIKDCSTKEHGGAFSVEEADVKWIMVNCLIEGNVSRNGGGYCGVAMIYNKTKFYAINNTIVNNYNFDEGGTPPDGRDEWSIMHSRDGGQGQEYVMINNLIVGNYSWCNTDNLPYPQYYNVAVNCASNPLVTVNVRNNMVCGGFWKDGDAALNSKNTVVASGLDITTIFNDPANGDYTPKGSAVGAGVYDSAVSAILGNYTKDLAGNPRTVDGKIDLGCYQSK